MERLLGQVAAGEVSPEEACSLISTAPFHDLGYAKIDTQRGLRTGASEVIYGEGKTSEQIVGIVSAMLSDGQARVLVTRLDADKSHALEASLPTTTPYTYHAGCRLGTVGPSPTVNGNGAVVVAAAGTSDIPVAEEAAVTAEFLGNRVCRLTDVGVAGIQRLLAHADDIARAQVVVAVAGMEGALASVIAGMASCPVIAVPTSVGYGASYGGLAALLAMINSCASGVSVVNIDNGFGAGYQASMINHVRVATDNKEQL